MLLTLIPHDHARELIPIKLRPFLLGFESGLIQQRGIRTGPGYHDVDLPAAAVSANPPVDVNRGRGLDGRIRNREMSVSTWYQSGRAELAAQ